MKQRCITVALLSLLSVGAAAAEWWDPAWAYRQRIDLNTSMLTEDLENFPVSIFVEDGSFLAEHAHDALTDLRVLDENGELLPTQILWRWDEGGEIHIQMPHFRADGAAQPIYLYYGNPAADPELAPEQPWDEAYRAVFHFSEDTDVTRPPSARFTVEGAVKPGEAYSFSGHKEGYLRIAPELLEGLGEQLTLSVRFRMEEGPGLQTLVSGVRHDAPEEWFNFGLKTPNTVHTNAASGGQRAPELNIDAIAPGAWHSAVLRYDARNHSRTVCVDGIHLSEDASLPGPLAVDEMRIGRGVLHFDPWQFHGAIDEVRIAGVARSDSWLRAEAACLSGRNTFAVLGPPQHRDEPAPPPGAFALLSPEDGMNVRSRKGTTLSWEPSPGAERYTVSMYANDHSDKALASFDAGSKTHLLVPLETVPQSSFFWSVRAESDHGAAQANERRQLSFYDWTANTGEVPQDAVAPVLRPVEGPLTDIDAFLGSRIDRVIDRYFLETPESSPAILQVFRDRDKIPVRDPLVPWAGEFAGKYLTAAQLTWRLTHDLDLKETIDRFVMDLLACQAEDGYLGPFPASSRLTGGNWDIWGHYHCMLGLMLYYEDTGYEPALDTCRKAADLLFETFGPGGPPLTNDGSGGEMNMAVCHGLVLLYRKTGVERYLDLAKYIVHEAWNHEGTGHYLENALAGKPLVEFPRHRWESLHDWQALAELYWLTGDEDYRKAFEHLWHEGIKDRHNTGGVTSGEGFTGSPYNTGAIETCCTVAWIAYSIDMLRMTGDPKIADEIEWSTLNSALGAIPHSGRACAYNVPMDGTRTYGVELPWQAPKAGPDLNCCAVNANRPLGMISQWNLMQAEDALVVNFYGPSYVVTTLPSGGRVTFEQETDYPTDANVTLWVSPVKEEAFTLRLRIPAWSKDTSIHVNGEAQPKPEPGTYYELRRTWNMRDRVEIAFDFSFRFWDGEESFAGKSSVYRGPLLLAFDGRYNDSNPDALPTLDRATLDVEPLDPGESPLSPWYKALLSDASGNGYIVTDFASAGQTGNHYRSWLPLR